MAAFDILSTILGGDKFAQLYAKYNDTMTALKAGLPGQFLGGNGAGSSPTMQYPLISYAVVNIGDWNMDSTRSVFIDISSAVSSKAKIRTMDIMIRPDEDTNYNKIIPLTSVQNAVFGDFTGLNSGPQGGVDFGGIDAGATTICLSRLQGGLFDSTGFDSAGGYNRGYVIIGYIQ